MSAFKKRKTEKGFKVTWPGTNYCGPGGYGDPTGKFDRACAKHDKAYSKWYDYIIPPKNGADEQFLLDILGEMGIGARIARTWFTTKLIVSKPLSKGLQQLISSFGKSSKYEQKTVCTRNGVL